VMTSVTLLAALASLLFLGPDVIFGFTAAMMLGIVIGTYSSIFVSSSLLIALGVKTRAAPVEASAERVVRKKA
jgi:preprotein translocase subunit SecF